MFKRRGTKIIVTITLFVVLTMAAIPTAYRWRLHATHASLLRRAEALGMPLTEDAYIAAYLTESPDAPPKREESNIGYELQKFMREKGLHFPELNTWVDDVIAIETGKSVTNSEQVTKVAAKLRALMTEVEKLGDDSATEFLLQPEIAEPIIELDFRTALRERRTDRCIDDILLANKLNRRLDDPEPQRYPEIPIDVSYWVQWLAEVGSPTASQWRLLRDDFLELSQPAGTRAFVDLSFLHTVQSLSEPANELPYSGPDEDPWVIKSVTRAVTGNLLAEDRAYAADLVILRRMVELRAAVDAGLDAAVRADRACGQPVEGPAIRRLKGFDRAVIDVPLLQRVHMYVLAVGCAIEAYRAEHGALPSDLRTLVPDYVHKLPRDPYDGHPLRYRPNGKGGYDLYSVGINGEDDNAMRTGYQIDAGDVVFTVTAVQDTSP